MRLSDRFFLIFLILIVVLILIYVLNDAEVDPDYYERRPNIVPTAAPTYNIWCIFTKATSKYEGIAISFRHMLVTLLAKSSVIVDIHLIVDDGSRLLAQSIVEMAENETRKPTSVYFYDVSKLTEGDEESLTAMKNHFSPMSGGYYSDSLFYASLRLDRIAPPSQHWAIMLDADLQFEDDIALLFEEFDKFDSESLIGVGPELSPVYHHLLYIYRSRNPNTVLGLPCCVKYPSDLPSRKVRLEPMSQFDVPGKSGVNSGVLLLHLDRIRQSKLYRLLRRPQYIQHVTEKYSFKGHLGDQDFYTLLSFDRPELIHLIDCGWNRQLCTWWREHGYSNDHHLFAYCPTKTRIFHANCKSPLPETPADSR